MAKKYESVTNVQKRLTSWFMNKQLCFEKGEEINNGAQLNCSTWKSVSFRNFSFRSRGRKLNENHMIAMGFMIFWLKTYGTEKKSKWKGRFCLSLKQRYVEFLQKSEKKKK